MRKHFCDNCGEEGREVTVLERGNSREFCSRKCFKEYYNLKEKWHDRIGFPEALVGIGFVVLMLTFIFLVI